MQVKFISLVTGLCLLVCSTISNAQNNKAKFISTEGVVYSVSVPDKWKTDEMASGREHLRVALLPENQSWETSVSKIYVNVVDIDVTKNETVTDVINFDKKMYKMSDNKVQVFDEKPIAIENGKRYAMAIKVDEGKNGCQATAYIAEKGMVPIIMMSSVSKKDFLRDYAIFEQVVASYSASNAANVVEVVK